LVGLAVVAIVLGEDFRLSILRRDDLLLLFRKDRPMLRLLQLHILQWKRCVLWRGAHYLVRWLYSWHCNFTTVLRPVLHMVKTKKAVTASVWAKLLCKFHYLGAIGRRRRVKFF